MGINFISSLFINISKIMTTICKVWRSNNQWSILYWCQIKTSFYFCI